MRLALSRFYAEHARREVASLLTPPTASPSLDVDSGRIGEPSTPETRSEPVEATPVNVGAGVTKVVDEHDDESDVSRGEAEPAIDDGVYSSRPDARARVASYRAVMGPPAPPTTSQLRGSPPASSSSRSRRPRRDRSLSARLTVARGEGAFTSPKGSR